MSVYKRTIFLINPKFQIRFALVMCTIVWISSLIYPITIVGLFDSFVKAHPAAASAVSEAKQDLLVFLVACQFIYVGFVFIICIFLTHKIAGPMFKLTNYLRSISQGAQPSAISFRTGDNFTEVAEEVNAAFDRLADEREEDYAFLTEVTSYINNLSLVVPEDKKPLLKEITDRLADIQKRLHGND